MNFRWRVAQFFEILWWKRYLREKKPEEYLAWKKAYWKRFLAAGGVEIEAGAQAFDAGCGPAGIFLILENQDVVALDPLLDEYERAIPFFKKAHFPQVRFVHSTLENYHADSLFDYVFCLNAINHVSDLEQSLDKLVGLTKTGGTILISIDAHNFQFLKNLFRLIPGDILHPHQFDLQEYCEMLLNRNCSLKNSVLIKKQFVFDYHLLVFEKK